MDWLMRRPFAVAGVLVAFAVVALPAAVHDAPARSSRPGLTWVMLGLSVASVAAFAAATRLSPGDPITSRAVLFALVTTPIVECVALVLAGGRAAACIPIAVATYAVLGAGWLLEAHRRPLNRPDSGLRR